MNQNIINALSAIAILSAPPALLSAFNTQGGRGLSVMKLQARALQDAIRSERSTATARVYN